jgi:small subunit ribosomal protein S1
MTEDPWSTIENSFPEQSRHMGTVKNITPYGVFVELSTGIGGMIHISDLSWLKRFNNPNEYTKVGNQIEVIILNIDKEGRKLQLGHKQIEEDPWNSLESVFAEGSIHEGTVVKKDDKGAVVQLPYGLEGFAPARHLVKEDGKTIVADELANFMVIEFDRNDKRIVLSHTRLWEQEKEEEKQILNKEKKAEAETTKKAVKAIQSKVEKTTLGDLGVLAGLKAKMDNDAAATDSKEAEPAVIAAEVKPVETTEPTATVKAEPKKSKKAVTPEVIAATEAADVKVEAETDDVKVEAKADDVKVDEEMKADDDSKA